MSVGSSLNVFIQGQVQSVLNIINDNLVDAVSRLSTEKHTSVGTGGRYSLAEGLQILCGSARQVAGVTARRTLEILERQASTKGCESMWGKNHIEVLVCKPSQKCPIVYWAI